MKISGFTFVHNAIESGYPIVEAIKSVHPFVDEVVVVDMQSTDGTTNLLHKMTQSVLVDKVIPGTWQPGGAGGCLLQNHALHVQCKYGAILHFEADEVFDPFLASDVAASIMKGYYDIAVWRLQVEQNFQRVRWYPTPVHRAFPKGSVTKDGETTHIHKRDERPIKVLGPEHGFLWDITNCFRDNWIPRVKKNFELWGGRLEFKYQPIHMAHEMIVTNEQGARKYMEEPHWTWRRSPFELPGILKDLVGVTKYEC